MYGKWMEQLKSRLQVPGYWVRFLTLYQDGRDAMSDSLKPSWEPTDQHKIEVYPNGGLDPVLTFNVNKGTGNQMYRDLRKLQTGEAVQTWVNQMTSIITANGTVCRNIGLHGTIKSRKELTTCSGC